MKREDGGRDAEGVRVTDQRRGAAFVVWPPLINNWDHKERGKAAAIDVADRLRYCADGDGRGRRSECDGFDFRDDLRDNFIGRATVAEVSHRAERFVGLHLPCELYLLL